MDTETETVVLLHGITRSDIDMAPLDIFLQTKGYRCINISYPSQKMPLEDLTTFVGRAIRDNINYNPFAPLHFITHSMGGLIARYFLATSRPPNLGKVVMLGTPNTGSEFADFLDDHEIFGDIFKTIFGPAGAQLKTTHKHIEGDIDYPLGIIAGSKSINPLAPWLLGKDENDGLVPVKRTKIDGMSDHIVMPVNHTVMMLSPSVMKQAHHFLQNSKFNKEKET